MSLNLYRRHRPECEGGHAKDCRSGEFGERKKAWKRCACLIFVSGTLAGKFKRKATDASDWEAAHRVAEAYEKAGRWPGQEDPQPVVVVLPAAPVAPSRTTIPDACTTFLANRESAGLAEATLRKYRTFTKQITAFGESRGYVMIDQYTPGDIDIFWAKWKLGPRAKAKRLTTLRAFFRFCVHRKWISESPVSPDIKAPVGSSKAVNKIPFTDEQLEDIIKACDHLEDQPWGNRHGTGLWTGEDVKDFIWVLTYTGLRISDAAFFDIDRLHGDEVFLRAKKNGGDIFTYIPDWLCNRLHRRVEKFGKRIFLTGGSTRLETVTDNWRQRLAKAFALADVGTEPATPHRFRHTFARILLEKGVPVADVADLLGDDEQTVREHYARWVPERQARLTRILKDAFSDKPRLVGIRGGRG